MNKFFFLLIVVFGLSSCSVEDDNSNVNFGYIGVDAVDMPDGFELGQVYEIEVDITLDNPCLEFAGFEMTRGGQNVRVVRTVAAQYQGDGCDEIEPRLITKIFRFEVIFNSDYTFKFSQGFNDQGEETFLEFVVPVNS